jgi:hypothetical protein
MSQETEQKSNNKSTQWIQLLVVVVALAIVAFFLIRFIYSFIWWIVAFLGLAVLLINRKMVMRVFNYIKDLYKKNTVLGVAGTVGGIIAFTPFLGFLLLKTIWDFRKNDIVGNKNKEKEVEKTAAPKSTTTKGEEKVDLKALEDEFAPENYDASKYESFDKGEHDQKFPPTEQ